MDDLESQEIGGSEHVRSEEGIEPVRKARVLQSSPLEMQAELCELAESLAAVDVRFFEGNAPLVVSSLVPRSIELLNEAAALVKRLELSSERMDRGGLTSAPIDEVLDEAVRGSEFPPASLEDRVAARVSLADTAFIIQMVLHTKRAALVSAPLDLDQDEEVIWSLIDRSASALRNMLKSLGALERVFCNAMGLVPKLQYASQLEISITIRRRYADLWRNACLMKPAPEELKTQFRRYGTGLAVLIGNSIYPELRVSDRRQIRSLQQRILGWLRSPHEHVREGHRIWGDVVGFSLLLRQVSRREELVRHDKELIAEMPRLFAGATEPISDELFKRVRALYGYCHPVDRLIIDRCRDREQWSQVATLLAATSDPSKY